MDYLILTINLGSTSTKIALYKNEEELFKESITHPHDEIEKYDSITDQAPMRMKTVLDALSKHGFKAEELSVVMGRGGMLPPVKVGGYIVNTKMLDLIKNEKIQQHASNLGAVLADEIAKTAGVKAYIYDAVTACEFPPVAKITGMKEIERRSFYHVLNCRAVSIRYAESVGKKYEDVNLLVTHLGGGITVGAHSKGKIIDSLADDNGPFAPERAGSVPLLDLIEMCYSGKYSKKEMMGKVRGKGGLRSLLGTSDGREIQKLIESGDKNAALVMEAQAYQIAKGIALLSPALRGDCDAIIITGGLAYNTYLIDDVKKYIGWLGKIVVMPGEYEMEALALGGLRILRNQEEVHEL
ncbi:MAG: butyrate kinase [Oscillospiraceae bacterium]|nr:butyrate kinase [Oscillospiraceae bacterium]